MTVHQHHARCPWDCQATINDVKAILAQHTVPPPFPRATWTAVPPNAPGFYWAKWADGDVGVVEVFEQEIIASLMTSGKRWHEWYMCHPMSDGVLPAERSDVVVWAGPIEMPQ